jgi:hypothetical protein
MLCHTAGAQCRDRTYDVASRYPAGGQVRRKLVVSGILWSRHGVCDPEHGWHRRAHQQIVEIELGRVPFRRLGSFAVSVQKLLLPVAIFAYGTVGYRRRGCETSVESVEAIDASEGRENHGSIFGAIIDGSQSASLGIH